MAACTFDGLMCECTGPWAHALHGECVDRKAWGSDEGGPTPRRGPLLCPFYAPPSLFVEEFSNHEWLVLKCGQSAPSAPLSRMMDISQTTVSPFATMAVALPTHTLAVCAIEAQLCLKYFQHVPDEGIKIAEVADEPRAADKGHGNRCCLLPLQSWPPRPQVFSRRWILHAHTCGARSSMMWGGSMEFVYPLTAS